MIDDSLKTIRNIHRLLIATNVAALVIVLSVTPHAQEDRLLGLFKGLASLSGRDYCTWAQTESDEDLRKQLNAEEEQINEELARYGVLDLDLSTALLSASHIEFHPLPESLSGPWHKATLQDIKDYTDITAYEFKLRATIPDDSDLTAKLASFLEAVPQARSSRVDDIAYAVSKEQEAPTLHLSFRLTKEGRPIATFEETIRTVSTTAFGSFSHWLAAAGALDMSIITDRPTFGSSGLYARPDLRNSTIEDAILILENEIAEKKGTNKTISILNIPVPGNLILIAVPVTSFVLSLYMIGHLVHLAELAHSAPGASAVREFAWVPFCVRGRAWILEPLLTIVFVPAALPLVVAARVGGVGFESVPWLPYAMSFLILYFGILATMRINKIRRLVLKDRNTESIESRVPSHPGEILQTQFLEPMDLTPSELADHLGVPVQRINEIVMGKGGVSPETAWLLSQAFDTTPDFWLNLQTHHDLALSRPEKAVPPLSRAG